MNRVARTRWGRDLWDLWPNFQIRRHHAAAGIASWWRVCNEDWWKLNGALSSSFFCNELYWRVRVRQYYECCEQVFFWCAIVTFAWYIQSAAIDGQGFCLCKDAIEFNPPGFFAICYRMYFHRGVYRHFSEATLHCSGEYSLRYDMLILEGSPKVYKNFNQKIYAPCALNINMRHTLYI